MGRMSRFNRVAGRILGPRLTLQLRRFRRGELSWQRYFAHLIPFRFRKDRPTTAHITARSFDALRNTRENLSCVRDYLDSLDVDYVELPNWDPYQPRLVIKEVDLARTLTNLQKLHEIEPSWIVKPISLGRRRTLRQHKGIDVISVHRMHVTPDGVPLSTNYEHVILEPWRAVGPDDARVDGGTYEAGTLLRNIQKRDVFIEYFTPEAWQHALAHNKKASWQNPHLAEVSEPVDIVYTWVDGDDPVWQAKKSAHLGDVSAAEINETAVSASRFMNRNELKYSLRSVEAYANWVNHIYIVTDGQLPEWLDTSHPKISVIHHRDIFADQQALPVFNSHAIESQLHHIPGLSERYLYMNDDVFMMRPVLPELFFTGNGMSKFFPSQAPLDLTERSSNDMPVLSAAKRGRAFIAHEHQRTVTNKFKHAPHPQLRSVLKSFEQDHPEVFETVSHSKFRHPDDYSIASSLYHYHAYALGKAVPGNIRYSYVDIAAPNAEARFDWWSRSHSLDVICINDTSTTSDMVRVNNFVVELLEKKFPVPSSFER